MFEYIIPKRSKLENFAPKILLCAGLIVLSVRNANIVSGKLTAKQKFISEVTVLGRALTKTFIHIPFVGTVMLEHHCANKRKNKEKHKVT